MTTPRRCSDDSRSDRSDIIVIVLQQFDGFGANSSVCAKSTRFNSDRHTVPDFPRTIGIVGIADCFKEQVYSCLPSRIHKTSVVVVVVAVVVVVDVVNSFIPCQAAVMAVERINSMRHEFQGIAKDQRVSVEIRGRPVALGQQLSSNLPNGLGVSVALRYQSPTIETV